ncbi:hypothetical protein M501DRAFT_1030049 [Patellaria atrata CBS 101060]|uniref:Shugoshin C-terminal domain-containing protein n=1 Tax=Patellaria atrata CBS 101060 TaxID=1346257 RepID=A0A9P4SDT1_9PEZI|nr:hypothetical protein M501DRAFT_1030049 [Patellaria atrata CBS 101060]
MARLNEVPVSTDSIEALKRRFIRQNRELAKSNSVQSIRIRNLEAETTRLVAENLSLREQIIELETVVERQQNGISAETINTVKDQLEQKIQELSTLAADLIITRSPPRCQRPEKTAAKKLPEERTYNNPLLASPSNEGGDGRLPVIAENKYYLRQTLEPEQIRDLITSQSSESPDLGPPPIAHFQDEDPIKFDALPPLPISQPHELDDNDDEAEAEPEDDIPQPIAIDTENRRKRRDSHSKLDIRRMSVFQYREIENGSGPEAEPEKTLPVRTGAKRKLSTREEDEKKSTESVDHAEEFRFSRKTTGASRFQGKIPEPNVTTTKGRTSVATRREKEIIKAAPVLDRRVLGDKSVNTDSVISPRKPTKVSQLDKKPDSKKPALPPKVSIKERNRDARRNTTIHIPQPEQKEVLETVEIEPDTAALPPKTPAGLDLFSPTISTEPSVARQESKDTPPPPDISSMTAAEAIQNGRAGRRARASVNYAEPNLISKMRRPTKDLVDAVQRDVRRSTSAQPELDRERSAPLTETKNDPSVSRIIIKRERDGNSETAWKHLPKAEPNSPLSNKSAQPLVTTSVAAPPDPTEERDPFSAALSKTDIPSESAAAISALTHSSSHRRDKSAPKRNTPYDADAERKKEEEEEEEEEEERPDLAIFEFTESSSPQKTSTAKGRRVTKEELARARSSRRHSSVPNLAQVQPQFRGGGFDLDADRGDENANKRVSSRRRTGRGVVSFDKDDAGDGDRVEESTAGERAANRRRSMML